MTPIPKQIRSAVAALAEADQFACKHYPLDGKPIRNLARKNADWLAWAIDVYGWPSPKRAGATASKAAWLIVQHADHDIAFQRRCLKIMRQVLRSERSPALKMYTAFVVDRIRVNEGRRQLYGTQCFVDRGGRFRIWPIEQIDTIERRRREFRLGTLKVFLRQVATRDRELTAAERVMLRRARPQKIPS